MGTIPQNNGTGEVSVQVRAQLGGCQVSRPKEVLDDGMDSKSEADNN